METREFATLMEKYIEFGYPIILENIGEKVESVFTPVLDKNLTSNVVMLKILHDNKTTKSKIFS